jgi:hypothetical protein
VSTTEPTVRSYVCIVGFETGGPIGQETGAALWAGAEYFTSVGGCRYERRVHVRSSVPLPPEVIMELTMVETSGVLRAHGFRPGYFKISCEEVGS